MPKQLLLYFIHIDFLLPNSTFKEVTALTMYLLKQLNWVEVTYDVKDNRITGIKSFVGGEALDKYSNVPKEI